MRSYRPQNGERKYLGFGALRRSLSKTARNILRGISIRQSRTHIEFNKYHTHVTWEMSAWRNSNKVSFGVHVCLTNQARIICLKKLFLFDIQSPRFVSNPPFIGFSESFVFFRLTRSSRWTILWQQTKFLERNCWKSLVSNEIYRCISNSWQFNNRTK